MLGPIHDETTVPLVFTVEEQLSHFLFYAGPPTPNVLDVALGRVGRDFGPALLAELFSEGLLTGEAATAKRRWCLVRG